MYVVHALLYLLVSQATAWIEFVLLVTGELKDFLGESSGQSQQHLKREGHQRKSYQGICTTPLVAQFSISLRRLGREKSKT